MANTAQAKKRARQAETHRERNAAQRSWLRSEIKKAREAVAGGDKAAASTALREAASVIDRMARKGLIHKNAAARYKSGLNVHLRALA
ncbi:MAG: 30S ribosomal protein S20 [Candidatus Muproteobacteria bacterium RBG_16_65_31]|uniref:Small ribosomal subunit protein bS20 n=1 Tax=Candidatus Muproteobacteria bacterium RBG_16_65_31 TaxID=1817759 RepID=A0A1F6TJ65_9PROT|nr:MAG: 30S ribosomal protein S20 [Candidatus Muproteobacteria bacterium RBG_16_65_31]